LDNTGSTEQWVSWFRQASPYINTHQNKTIVLALSGAALATERLENLIHDIALLNTLGVRLVIVFGARPQIDAVLEAQGKQSVFSHGLRVTKEDELPGVLQAYGGLRAALEAKLSMGVINSPMHGSSIKVVSGNFVTAKPVGVLDGVDFACTGLFRKLDVQAVNQHLVNKDIVLVPALGYAATGEIFNLGYEQLAGKVAAHLEAEKLIIFGEQKGCLDDQGVLLKQMDVQMAERAIQSSDASEIKSHLDVALKSCQRGVKRVHLISYKDDAALLQELFTRDGSGTMVSQDDYDEIRPAQLEDINGILELVKPLEEKGILVRRARERIESELDRFVVNVRDNAIIGCAALYLYPQSQLGELSCFAVDQSYRQEGRGDKILDAIEQQAQALGLKKVFVLTTQTEHWFKERGFVASDIRELPGAKLYNTTRNAKVLVKNLN